MGKNKFYAVRIGRKPGIYLTWDECRRQTTGYPSAAFKGFETKEEALAFLSPTNASAKGAAPFQADAVAYVDGSFSKEKRACSYGVVLFHEGLETRLSGKLTEPDFLRMNNVGGEVKGAEAAMRHCISNGISSLEIVHDYQGIASWYTGDWQAKEPGAKAYKTFCDWVRPQLDVRFTKVKSHSGDKLNDEADMLARRELGL
jgi:ribonuclease HI